MEELIGNAGLLSRHKIGFLAPSYVASLSVLPALDWAVSVAAREDVSVVSGFSSRMERDVLTFLSKGKCGIVLVLARCHYKQLPPTFGQLMQAGRLLVISVSSCPRQSKKTAALRNLYVCKHSDTIVMPSVPPRASSLYGLYTAFATECLLCK